MRGRGIGTARGRATIMRGLLPAFHHVHRNTDLIEQPMVLLLQSSEMEASSLTVFYSSSWSGCAFGERHSAVISTFQFIVLFTKNICCFLVPV
jgi:hypothetical protein